MRNKKKKLRGRVVFVINEKKKKKRKLSGPVVFVINEKKKKKRKLRASRLSDQ